MTDINKEIKDLSKISYDINKNGKDHKIDHNAKIVKITELLKSSSIVTPYVFTKLKLKCNSQNTYLIINPNAKSACTTISLLAAITLLQNIKSNTKIDCDSINDIISKGVKFHSDDAHTDIETAWSKLSSMKSLVNLCGDTQGIITNQNIEFNNILYTIYSKEINPFSTNFENIDDNKYTGIIITKQPETICVILPPLKDKESGKENFIYFNSHNRDLDTDYTIESFSSFKNLIDRLKIKYPYMDMGDDYNSIEANAIQLK